MLLAGGLDMKATLAGKQHYLLYCLTPAMKPRMLMTGRAPAAPPLPAHSVVCCWASAAMPACPRPALRHPAVACRCAVPALPACGLPLLAPRCCLAALHACASPAAP